MEIFVSEKEIPENCAECIYYNNHKCLIDNNGYKWTTQAPIQKNKLCPIKSLEQHESKIRKPLEEEIEQLKVKIQKLASECKDCTKKVFKEDLIAERQKVIAELEEFEKEHRLRARKTSEEYQTDNEEQKARLYSLSSGRFDILEELKQKLKEMKGVK